MSMDKESATQILKRLESGYLLPPLSVIALSLLEMASNETTTVMDMVCLIEKDPSLAVRLLNLANSAFFAAGRRVSTLKQAAMRLGCNNLRIMALSISLRGAFPMGKIQQFDYEQFWRLSIYRALIAKSLAEQSQVCNPEEAFVAGLILEIGLPIFFDLFVREKQEDFSLEMEPLEDLLLRERERFGIDHRQVGKAALKFWKFPESFIACQSLYGELARSPSAPLFGNLSELSRLFSKMLIEESAEFHSFFAEAESALKLTPEVVHEIVLGTFAEVQEIAGALKLEINKERDMMEVMEKANRALIGISERVSKYATAYRESALPTFNALDQEDRTIAYTLQAVAHEIRNPLTAVGGFAKRLAYSLDPDSQVGRYARVIVEEAKRLEEILAGMPREIQRQMRHSRNE